MLLQRFPTLILCGGHSTGTLIIELCSILRFVSKRTKRFSCGASELVVSALDIDRKKNSAIAHVTANDSLMIAGTSVMHTACNERPLELEGLDRALGTNYSFPDPSLGYRSRSPRCRRGYLSLRPDTSEHTPSRKFSGPLWDTRWEITRNHSRTFHTFPTLVPVLGKLCDTDSARIERRFPVRFNSATNSRAASDANETRYRQSRGVICATLNATNDNRTPTIVLLRGTRVLEFLNYQHTVFHETFIRKHCSSRLSSDEDTRSRAGANETRIPHVSRYKRDWSTGISHFPPVENRVSSGADRNFAATTLARLATIDSLSFESSANSPLGNGRTG